jgi:hypothetical protein
MSWSAMRWATDRRDAGSGRRVSSTRRSSWRIVSRQRRQTSSDLNASSVPAGSARHAGCHGGSHGPVMVGIAGLAADLGLVDEIHGSTRPNGCWPGSTQA